MRPGEKTSRMVHAALALPRPQAADADGEEQDVEGDVGQGGAEEGLLAENGLDHGEAHEDVVHEEDGQPRHQLILLRHGHQLRHHQPARGAQAEEDEGPGDDHGQFFTGEEGGHADDGAEDGGGQEDVGDQAAGGLVEAIAHPICFGGGEAHRHEEHEHPHFF